MTIWGPIVRGGEWPAQAWIILLALTALAAIYYYRRRNENDD